jgi:hypothetical protein
MNRFFGFFAIIMMTFSISCRNNSEFNNEDAERNSWLTSFLQGKNIIEGRFNHSENIIEFFIEINSIDIFFSNADSIALTEGWELTKFDPIFRVYSKEMKTIGGFHEVIILKLEFKSPNLLKVNVY